MHLPILDPNFVLWCNVIADVFTCCASGVAAFAAMKLYLHKLREIAGKL